MQSSLCADFFRDWRAEGKELPAAGAASSRASAPLRNQLPPRPLLVGHPSQLPHNMRAQYDPTRRRQRGSARPRLLESALPLRRGVLASGLPVFSRATATYLGTSVSPSPFYLPSRNTGL
eukprot:CAMPEP_0171827262 /NCGR_PEP_ID=MMETSP0992-20121227/6540_1 /TAXON_ID=483369 /ORGANISM="non described non described, Strain CCMP2098" /LENGTH=119 /DNA_ID=CAMNT_0012442375 /DNA_START=237 /DNA_END=593 /DNA_ORIENTATION=+